MISDAMNDRRYFGLFGEIVAGNPTEEMMEAAFSASGSNWKYISMAIAPDRFEAAVEGARTLGFAGFHVTKPYKIRALDTVDELTGAAAAIGAVNCVVRRAGRLVGDNTDGRGLVNAVQDRFDVAGSTVVVLGAGGAARAVAVETALAGARRVTIVSRSEAPGRSLVDAVDLLGTATCQWVGWTGTYEVPSGTDLVVNATSVGMADPAEPVAVDLEAMGSHGVAADVVISAEPTAFIADADRRGVVAIAGAAMLVEQAAISFQLWSGLDPDRDVLRTALIETLVPGPSEEADR